MLWWKQKETTASNLWNYQQKVGIVIFSAGLVTHARLEEEKLSCATLNLDADKIINNKKFNFCLLSWNRRFLTEFKFKGTFSSP